MSNKLGDYKIIKVSEYDKYSSLESEYYQVCCFKPFLFFWKRWVIEHYYKESLKCRGYYKINKTFIDIEEAEKYIERSKNIKPNSIITTDVKFYG